MTDRMTFVHLSDTHIAPKGEMAYGTDTAQNLRDVARRVREMQLDPACFIFSGDLSNHGESESYEYLREILDEEYAPFGVPILLGLGNHDRRLPFRHVMLGQVGARDEDEQFHYSQLVGDLQVVMLDSMIPGRVHGELGERQLAWLDEQLSHGAPGGQVVVLHHPSLPRGVPRPDDYLLIDRPAFAEVLERYEVLAVLCGHSHVATVGLFGGTLHVAAPATAYLLDPSMREGGRGVEGAGFNICTIREGRLMVNPVVMPGAQRELYRHSKTFTAMTEPEPVATHG